MRKLQIVGAVFIAISAKPAFAQSETGGSIARQSQDIFNVSNKESDYFEHTFRASSADTASAYSNALRFAACATRLDKRTASTILASDAGTPKETSALRDLTRRYGTCAVARASLSPVMVRGAIAETMWKSAGAHPNPTGRSTVDIEDVESFIKAAPLGEQRVKSANLPLSFVSRCQVMTLPADSAKVMSAIPGSREERAAAEVLYARSKVCGVSNGLENTPPILVRAGLADAFYQDGRRVTIASSK